MALLWTAPREWEAGEGITATKMNAISNDLLYLFDRPSAMVNIRANGAANVTTTSTTWTAVDDNQFTLTLEISSQAQLETSIAAMVSHSVLGGYVNMDVIVDDTTYLSSLTGTPAAGGLWTTRGLVAGAPIAMGCPIRIPAGSFAAGVHTFKLRWKIVTAGTGTLYLTAASAMSSFQWYVGEH